MTSLPPSSPSKYAADTDTVPDATHLRELTPLQWRAGIASWLGWLFDGLDGYLYILVAAPFVAQLLNTTKKDPQVSAHSAYIQAAFLVGWAIGGAFFGRVGDRIGRSRTISLTILTYAACTGLSGLAQTWQQLMLFRFLAALGIGGEWAAGSSLIAETWPRKWRPWLSAVLQSAYQVGILLASVAGFLLADKNPRWVFAVGVLPALLVFWIRRAIPEPDEWHKAKENARTQPRVSDLFRGQQGRITIMTVLLCSAALTTTWGFMFWFPQQLRRLPDIAPLAAAEQNRYITYATALAMVVAIGGNFFAAAMARYLGYRKATFIMFAGGLISMYLTYHVVRDSHTILLYANVAHFFVQGVFGLFPLYIPPLFPPLLRTTGAGFCYNFGRLVAAAGTVIFSFYVRLNSLPEFNAAMLWIGYLYIPALVIAFFIPEPGHAKEEG